MTTKQGLLLHENYEDRYLGVFETREQALEWARNEFPHEDFVLNGPGGGMSGYETALALTPVPVFEVLRDRGLGDLQGDLEAAAKALADQEGS